MYMNESISSVSSELKGEKARYVEGEACDQTVTLHYRVSLEGFVNVTQLQRSGEAHCASFSPPAVCATEGGLLCVAASTTDCIYIQCGRSLPSSVFLCSVCVCMCLCVQHVKAV